ncbi:phosphoesterase [Thiohalobacter sp. COW1]|uniref:metallophosphoesterase family protein n=1 Tax=Thiohalobacter sp. COW1 TaxID=2795687 RepID=UPI0019154860|nr:metallophosphoesterase family protein [Thiohalobacter sp. COW1]BCO31737.1 phosphoesterase [Thiohalobacter sp. COW1]
MRIALLADTHGYLDPRIAERVARCDLAVHAGDIGSAQVLDQLRPRSGEVVAIRGNNDIPAKWPAAERMQLDNLEWEITLALPGGELVAVHGHRCRSAAQRHQRLRGSYPRARAIVYGHSHRLACDDAVEPWVINPGAAGRSRTYGGPSFIVLIAGPRRWRLEPQRFPPLTRQGE